MTRRSSFIPEFLTMLLVVQIANFTQGKPHNNLTHPLDVDISSEASLAWPEPYCFDHKPVFPEETWRLWFAPEPKCHLTNPDPDRYSMYCEYIIPSKDGCLSWQGAASVFVVPGNCTVRVFEDENCTKLVDDPNAEYGPTPEPIWSLDKELCVEIGDNPATEDSRGSFNVTCPGILMENEGHIENTGDLDLLQEVARIEYEDIADPQIDEGKSATGTTEQDPANGLGAYSSKPRPELGKIDDDDWPPWNCSSETDSLKWIVSFQRVPLCGFVPGHLYEWKTHNWTDLDCVPWDLPMINRLVWAVTCKCTIELFQESACEVPLDTEAAQIGPATGEEDAFASCLELWRPGNPVNGSFRVTCPE